MEQNSKVSLIMPCFNSERFLALAIESVINQTYKNWELIIVDDGSTDNSFGIANNYSKINDQIKIVRKSNGGVSSARNYGYKFICPDSEYIFFPDSDDILDSNILSVLLSEMKSSKNIGLVYCDYKCINEKSEIIEKLIIPRYIPTLFSLKTIETYVPITNFLSIFLWTNIFEALTLIRRTAFEKTNGWDEELGNIGEGVDLFSEIALSYDVRFVNFELYNYRRYSNQVTHVSSDVISRQQKKVIQKWRNKSAGIHRQLINYAIFVSEVNNVNFRIINSIKHDVVNKKRNIPVYISKIAYNYLLCILKIRVYYRFKYNLFKK